MKRKTIVILFAILCLSLFCFTACSDDIQNGDSNAQEGSCVDADNHTHEYVGWETIKEASCTEKGEKQKRCSCGNVVTEEIDAIGHTEEVVVGKEATCTESGLTDGVKCTACGKITAEQKVIPIQHKYKNSYVCTLCDYVSAIESVGFIFEVDAETDTYKITGMGTCTDKDIVVPYTYDGKLVTSIGAYAFDYCDSITSIKLPNCLTSIEERAFFDCDGIKSLTFEANSCLKSIGNAAFADCDGLTSVTFEDGCQLRKIGNSMFYDCGELKTVKLPMGLTEIGSYAFSYSYNLKDMVIPGSVVNIDGYAFSFCSGLKSIEISSEILKIGEYTFTGCYILGEVNYLGDIEHWCEISYITESSNPLYFGANLYINGKMVDDLVIPKTIKSLNSYAFANCGGLTSVSFEKGSPIEEIVGFEGCSDLMSIEIPNSVTYIRPNAFYGCENLTDVRIPSSVTKIGGYAFYDCDSLTIYCETENKQSGWDFNWNSSGCPVVWNCNYNEVANNGYIYAMIDGIRYGIKDSGAIVAEQPKNIETAVIPKSITYSGKTYPVTCIVSEAFARCYNLTSIEIPNSVTKIGYNVFDDCVSLTIYCEITEQPKGWDAWSDTWNNSECPVVWDCKNNDLADDGCAYTVVDNIRYRIYFGYDGNSKAIVAKQSRKIEGEIIIAESITYKGASYPVTSISNEAFYNCNRLIRVAVPKTVDSVGADAFSYCWNLTIYCEAESQPDGWNSEWNYSKCPVVWGTDFNNN